MQIELSEDEQAAVMFGLVGVCHNPYEQAKPYKKGANSVIAKISKLRNAELLERRHNGQSAYPHPRAAKDAAHGADNLLSEHQQGDGAGESERDS